MNNNNQNYYCMFVDESGESNLNHAGKYFILSTVIIKKSDFTIIQGYLRLLKRKYMGDDLKNIHMTDLCERIYQKYRKLLKPKNRVNSFFSQLIDVIKTIPFQVGLYYVNKNKIRKGLNYTPGKKKKNLGVYLNLPYEIASLQAFYDYSDFLNKNKSTGEIIAESRFQSDGEFIGYFDKARKKMLPKNIVNTKADNVKKLINSITISNKKVVDSGLELADIGAYCFYRKLNGDPEKKIKVPLHFISTIKNIFERKSYLNNERMRIGTKKVVL